MNTSIPKDISTVIHVGAGRCGRLKDYLAEPNRQIFLYDVETRFINALKVLGNKHLQLHVHQSAVYLGEGPKSITFHSYSDERYTSAYRLSENFASQQPNLEHTHNIEMEALSLQDVMEAQA